MVAPPPSPSTSSTSSYPRPASIGSPFRNRWGVGKLTTKPGEVYIGSMGGANKNVPLSAFSGRGAWASLSPEAQKKLYEDAKATNYGHDMSESMLDSFLERTAANAYSVQQSTGLMVDPLSYWDYYRQNGGYGLASADDAAAGAGGGGGGGPRVSRSTNVSKSVDLTNPTTARALVDDVLERYLGRGATGNDYSTFMKALNRAQKRNPTRSKTTSVVSSGGGSTMSNTSSVTKGGVQEAQFAKEWAQSQEGAAEYQAATSVLDSFMKLLGE